MEFDKFLEAVSKVKNISLPGEASQFKMSPPFRLELVEKQREAMKHARKASVLALFYPDSMQITNLALILRKTYKGVHSAQVGFPGGKVETTDESLKHTALRETREEIGVPEEDVMVLKTLSEMYIPPSNFHVYPFLGTTSKTPNFIKQDEEVEAIIEVKLSDLVDDQFVVQKIVMVSSQKEVEVPAYNFEGNVIWGATAMMLSEIKDLLKQVI
ncbi:MAG: coenzyme A pyrophosphatase [Bacteroidetes bacterium MedPE-SWsnd-G2]|nr:MAG: coenzyme A pyrophosphatase [Bacteroidetes bacterium MedPE-SWsnd-G2]